MTHKENITAILECYFSGFKKEIIDSACNRILEQQQSEDCRNCKKWNECPCGKEGHENGTSIGYSIGECKDYEPCDDCISRQEVIMALTGDITDCTIEEFIARLRTRLNKLPSVTPKERTGWIPISEGLPEEYGEYLITWTTSQSKRPFIGISEGEITGEYDHKHNRFKFEWLLEDYIKVYPDVEVIAWMPLPEPYKAGDTDESN